MATDVTPPVCVCPQVSFADGSSARVSAINAAMRQYRPSYMHFWQLKSFWHAAKLCQVSQCSRLSPSDYV